MIQKIVENSCGPGSLHHYKTPVSDSISQSVSWIAYPLVAKIGLSVVSRQTHFHITSKIFLLLNASFPFHLKVMKSINLHNLHFQHFIAHSVQHCTAKYVTIVAERHEDTAKMMHVFPSPTSQLSWYKWSLLQISLFLWGTFARSKFSASQIESLEMQHSSSGKCRSFIVGKELNRHNLF